MMTSITTKQGDRGQTGLIGGITVSKSHIRVDALGHIDELSACIGLARAICQDVEIKDILKQIQRELFVVNSSLAAPPDSQKKKAIVSNDMVETLTKQVEQIENIPSIVMGWAVAGEYLESAYLEVARTVCRRAERQVVKMKEEGEKFDLPVIAYLNRLSDLLWLLARLTELRAGITANLENIANTP